jgi:hypothetical protein
MYLKIYNDWKRGNIQEQVKQSKSIANQGRKSKTSPNILSDKMLCG